MSIDVVSAFLEVELDERTVIYMYIEGDQAFINPKGQIVVELLRAQYGVLEFALLFYQKLRGVLEELGFEANCTDQCVFNKIVEGAQCTASFHEAAVDDVEGKFTSVKRQRGVEFMHLGVLVSRQDDGSIELSQDLCTRVL